jgi:hypothetical protein
MYSFNRISRKLIKGLSLGAVLGLALPLAYRTVTDTVNYISGPAGQRMNVLGALSAFPITLFEALFTMIADNSLITLIGVGLVTGGVCAVLAIAFEHKLKPVALGVLAAVLAIGPALYFLNSNQALGLAASLQIMLTFYWLPALLYVVAAGWLGWRLRRGSIA